MLRLALAAVIAVAGGCYAPSEPACRVRCGDGGACPAGLACVDHFCAPEGTPAGTCCPAPTGATLFVDPSHVSAANGSADCPFASITAAARAAAPGTTLQVAAGVYSAASGEQFPIDLRHGLSLVGAGASSTFVDGVAVYDTRPDGGFLASFLPPAPWRAQLLIGDDVRASRVSGVTLRNSDLQTQQLAVAVICAHGNTPRTGAVPPANTVLDHVVITGAFEAGIAATNTDATACNLLVTASQVSDAYLGLWTAGHVDNLVLPPLAIQVGDGTTSGAVEFAFIHGTVPCNVPGDMGHPFTLACGGGGAGVALSTNTRQALVLGNHFHNSDTAVSTTMSELMPTIVLDGNEVEASTHGMVFRYNSIGMQVRDNTFHDCGVAIDVFDGAAIVARGNTIVGNNTGVYISGAPIGVARPIDFGTDADWGRNTLACNSRRDLMGSMGYDFALDGGAFSGGMPLAGNTWDHVPPTMSTSTAFPDGSDLVLVTNVPSAVNVDLAVVAGALCPTGYIH
jgi:hypothetical protein